MARDRGPRPYTARGPVDGEDWQAVADALNTRMAERRIGQQALSAASGVSVATLRQLQHGMTGRRAQNATLSAVSRALGWPDDHLTRVLLTGHQNHEPAEPTTRDLFDALRRIEAQLVTVNDRLDAVEHAVRGLSPSGAGR